MIGNRCHKRNSCFSKFIKDTFFEILKCKSVSVLGTYMCNTALASNDIVCKRYIIAVEISKRYKISPVIKSLICAVILSDNISACEFFKESLFALCFEVKVFVIYIINLFILTFTSVRLFYLYYSVFFHNALFKGMLPAFSETSAIFVHCIIESSKRKRIFSSKFNINVFIYIVSAAHIYRVILKNCTEHVLTKFIHKTSRTLRFIYAVFKEITKPFDNPHLNVAFTIYK